MKGKKKLFKGSDVFKSTVDPYKAPKMEPKKPKKAKVPKKMGKPSPKLKIA